MFQKFFRTDNPLMITFAQISDCVFLSLFWVLLCLPLVTAGAATTALYDTVVHTFRRGNPYSWRRFFQVFRAHLKPALAPTLVALPCLALLSYALIQLWNQAVYGVLSWTVFSACALIGVLLLGILSVLFPLLSRFETRFGTLLKNTLLLSLANLPRTLALGLLNTVAALLCLRYLFPLFFLPALAALIGTLFLEPMFRPYMPD